MRRSAWARNLRLVRSLFALDAAVYAWAAQRQTLSMRVVWALGVNELLNFAVGVAVIAIEGTGLTPSGSALVAAAADIYLVLGLAQLIAARRALRDRRALPATAA